MAYRRHKGSDVHTPRKPKRRHRRNDDDDEYVGDDRWLINKIIDSNTVQDQVTGEDRTQYLVKWKGFDSNYTSWVDEEDMIADKKLLEFKRSRSANHESDDRAGSSPPTPSTRTVSGRQLIRKGIRGRPPKHATRGRASLGRNTGSRAAKPVEDGGQPASTTRPSAEDGVASKTENEATAPLPEPPRKRLAEYFEGETASSSSDGSADLSMDEDSDDRAQRAALEQWVYRRIAEGGLTAPKGRDEREKIPETEEEQEQRKREFRQMLAIDYEPIILFLNN